jgi:hypothetical protein
MTGMSLKKNFLNVLERLLIVIHWHKFVAPSTIIQTPFYHYSIYYFI